MKKTHIGILLPLLLTSTSILASNLFQSDPPPSNLLTKNNFVNYNVENPESSNSYTLGIELQGKYSLSSNLIGSSGYSPYGKPYPNQDTSPGECFFEQGSYFPKVLGYMIVSNSQSKILFHLRGGFEEKNITTNSYNAKTDNIIYIPYLTPATNKCCEYSSLTVNGGHRYADMQMGLSGYAIEKNNFSLSSIIGATGSFLSLESTIGGKKFDDSFNCFHGTQLSFSAGLWGNIQSNLILNESEESAIFLSGTLNYTSEINFNDGETLFYVPQQESNILSRYCNIPKYSKTNFCSKKLSITLVSKPTDEDKSFLTLCFGIGSDTNFNKNLLNLILKNSSSDISSTYGFMKISLTM